MQLELWVLESLKGTGSLEPFFRKSDYAVLAVGFWFTKKNWFGSIQFPTIVSFNPRDV